MSPSFSLTIALAFAIVPFTAAYSVPAGQPVHIISPYGEYIDTLVSFYDSLVHMG